MSAIAIQYNLVTPVAYKHGWPGLFSAENQAKALNRALVQIGADGRKVAATVVDRWSLYEDLRSPREVLTWLGRARCGFVCDGRQEHRSESSPI